MAGSATAQLAAVPRGLWQAAHAGRRVGDAEAHARRAAAWLRAARRDGGFAHSFHLFEGWQAPYPETTGYILPSLHAAAERFALPEAAAMIAPAARWLATVQQPDGGFLDLAGRPQVFDTGQVLHGWNHLAARQPDLIDADRLARAAGWLVAQQEPDGSFVRHTWRGARSYYVKVGAALLAAGQRLDDPEFVGAGLRNLGWTLAQQRGNGFFAHAGFDADAPPFLHTMAYVAEGLLDAFGLTGDDRFQAAALRLAQALQSAGKRDGVPRSRYRADFASVDRELCLPGLAQWAAVCFRLARLGHGGYATSGETALAVLKRRQLVSPLPGLDGGLFGSAPFWGRYLRWSVPNWGVKYLLDALVLSETAP